MPAEGLPWLERAAILNFEEIVRLVRLLVALGVQDVRLTGGEPLVRRDFPLRLIEFMPLDADRAWTPTRCSLVRRSGKSIAEALPHALDRLAGRSPH